MFTAQYFKCSGLRCSPLNAALYALGKFGMKNLAILMLVVVFFVIGFSAGAFSSNASLDSILNELSSKTNFDSVVFFTSVVSSICTNFCYDLCDSYILKLEKSAV
ncbi:hypothetical protein F0231_20220 [Vibrio sp. RE86]|nr:hypothetical protein [Vibrio sp. RE86]